MNVTDFIFSLFHIRNFLTLSTLIPLRSPYTPFVGCAHLFTDYENTYGDCTNFFADCTNFFVDCAHNSDDCVNILDE